MALILQYPYIDEKGKVNNNLIKIFSDKDKPILKIETGEKYIEVIDLYPTSYTYMEIENDEETENGRIKNID